MDQLIREANPPQGQIASPKPQYAKADQTGYEAVKGEHGAPYALILDKDGNKINPATAEGLLAIKGVLESVGVSTDAKLEAVRVLLSALDGKDYATQTTLAALQTELTAVKSELASIKANQTSGYQKVTLSGTIKELYSMDIADRPDYTTIAEPTVFVLINANLDTWVTDGSADWVEV